MVDLSRYFYTVRYLKPQQMLGRVWFRLARPRPNELAAPPVRLLSGAFSSPARRQPSLLDAETFRFLNHTGSLAELGWTDAVSKAGVYLPTKLWRYNLHYFDDLNALNAAQRKSWHQSLLQRWVAENPPGMGTGWEPYPTSLRIVNWVKWQCGGNGLPDACVQSLAVQARWLAQRLERHILGNHLFANAKALVFAGCFFSGHEANTWLGRGLAIIRKELPEQVLQDGGNFERSPMYHAIFWEDLMDLINLSQSYPETLPAIAVTSWRKVGMQMQVWMNGMSHPDGVMAFFNDAAMGIAPSLEELNAYAERLGVGINQAATNKLQHFASSGYIRLASAQAVAFLDVAPVGPDYLPGHAHADTLSFEWSLFGQRVVTNGGTSEYGTGNVRQLERGTAAHSTVTINGENSSEVWGGFRVARRAYPLDLTIDERTDRISVRCSHTGYRRLRGKPVHQREWQWSEFSLEITDTVSGPVEHVVARFHLHPDIKVVESKPSGYTLALPGGQSLQVFVEHGAATLGESHYAPEFGKRILRACLLVELTDQRSRVRFVWDPHH